MKKGRTKFMFKKRFQNRLLPKFKNISGKKIKIKIEAQKLTTMPRFTSERAA
jgi:hypothetical protein